MFTLNLLLIQTCPKCTSAQHTHEKFLYPSLQTNGTLSKVYELQESDDAVFFFFFERVWHYVCEINPYLTNGFSHYQLVESTFIFRDVRSDSYFLSHFL